MAFCHYADKPKILITQILQRDSVARPQPCRDILTLSPKKTSKRCPYTAKQVNWAVDQLTTTVECRRISWEICKVRFYILFYIIYYIYIYYIYILYIHIFFDIPSFWNKRSPRNKRSLATGPKQFKRKRFFFRRWKRSVLCCDQLLNRAFKCTYSLASTVTLYRGLCVREFQKVSCAKRRLT